MARSSIKSPGLQIRVRDLLPEQIPLSVLGEFLKAVESAVLGAATEHAPGERKLAVSLVRIGRQSTGLSLATSDPYIVKPAFREVAKAVKNSDILHLPRRSREGVVRLKEFVVEWHRVLEFRLPEVQRPLAVLRPDTPLYPSVSPLVTGATEIYGKLERIGGAEPRAALRLSNEETLRFDVTEEVARELAPFLYQWVRLSGEATWNPIDNGFETFKLERILPYRPTPITEALAGVGEIAGRYWEGVDVQAEVARIRYGDEEP